MTLKEKDKKWFWMMKYCESKEIPPAQNWAWKQAGEAYKKQFNMKTALELITEERSRQIEKEGYSLEHDDTHIDGEIADAAAVYALSHSTIQYLDNYDGGDVLDKMWPWDSNSLKRNFTNSNNSSRIKDLVKAGALIAAEIERLQRLEK